MNCHEHATETKWYTSLEMIEVGRLFHDRGTTAGHINSDKQLDSPKSKAYARAIGQSDPYDLRGKCVTCHTTVYAGDVNAGVSCEKCHGAAKGYLKLHQTKGNYQQAVSAGMLPLVGQIDVWARQCFGCHIVTIKALTDAGHRSGDDFDLSVKFQPVALHFRSGKGKYSQAEIAVVWNRLRPRPNATVAARPAEPPAPSASLPQPPAPVSTAPPRALSTAPVPAPAPAPPPPAVVSAPAPPPELPGTRGSVNPPVKSPPPDGGRPNVGTSKETAAASLPPSATLAAVQGRLITALTQLLRQGNRVPVRLKTSGRAVPYNGPDAALLELQSEAIALAIEVLGRRPIRPPGH